jgi:prevent-host-death family protein
VEIGTRELRANLAAALRQVGAGERLVITVDGRPVAQLGPLEPTGAPTLADLAASGLVEPPRRARPSSPPTPADPAVDVRLDRVLAEVRGG